MFKEVIPHSLGVLLGESLLSWVNITARVFAHSLTSEISIKVPEIMSMKPYEAYELESGICEVWLALTDSLLHVRCGCNSFMCYEMTRRKDQLTSNMGLRTSLHYIPVGVNTIALSVVAASVRSSVIVFTAGWASCLPPQPEF